MLASPDIGQGSLLIVPSIGPHQFKAGSLAVQLARSEAALKVLEGTPDAKGRKIEVTKLPLPPPLYYEEHEAIHEDTGAVDREAGGRLAASYTNFYICNGAVICPAFGGAAAETDKG